MQDSETDLLKQDVPWQLRRDLELIRRVATAGSSAALDVSDIGSWAGRVRELDPTLEPLSDFALLTVMRGIAAAHLANEKASA